MCSPLLCCLAPQLNCSQDLHCLRTHPPSISPLQHACLLLLPLPPLISTSPPLSASIPSPPVSIPSHSCLPSPDLVPLGSSTANPIPSNTIGQIDQNNLIVDNLDTTNTDHPNTLVNPLDTVSDPMLPPSTLVPVTLVPSTNEPPNPHSPLP